MQALLRNYYCWQRKCFFTLLTFLSLWFLFFIGSISFKRISIAYNYRHRNRHTCLFCSFVRFVLHFSKRLNISFKYKTKNYNTYIYILVKKGNVNILEFPLAYGTLLSSRWTTSSMPIPMTHTITIRAPIIDFQSGTSWKMSTYGGKNYVISNRFTKKETAIEILFTCKTYARTMSMDLVTATRPAPSCDNAIATRICPLRPKTATRTTRIHSVAVWSGTVGFPPMNRMPVLITNDQNENWNTTTEKWTSLHFLITTMFIAVKMVPNKAAT